MPRLMQYENKELEGKDKQAIEYMKQRNLLHAEAINVGDGVVIYRRLELSQDGHDLLASITNNEVYLEIKRRAESEGLTVDTLPLTIIKDLAGKILRERLEI